MSSSSAGPRVDDAIASLHAAVDAFAALDLRDVPAASLGDVVERVVAVQRRFDAQVLRAVETFDAVQAWQVDGATSGAAWLRANVRLTPGAARAMVRTARRLRELPTMSEALACGSIDRAHVQVVTSAMSATPERAATIAAAEPTFCTAAKALDPAQLARVVSRWSHTVDPLGSVEAERAVHAQRFLSVSRTFDGAVALNGLLAPEAGALVLSALGARSTQDYREGSSSAGDEGSGARTPGQRRADALVDLCREYLDAGRAPEIAGVRPHVQVTVPLASLSAAPGEAGYQPGELEGIGPLSAEASRRISCDASVTGVGVDVDGMPLSYGRTARVVPPSLRRFVVARDRGCRFPGCDRPAAWTQAHHLVHWSQGGATEAENLALVCQHHHHCLHEGGFSVRGSPSTGLRFNRPDGTLIEDRGRAP